MQNERFEFMFYDKSGVDEKSFFLFFMPRLSRPEEKPGKASPVLEGMIEGFRGDKEPPSRKNEYSPSPDTFYSATYDLSTGGLEINVLTIAEDSNAVPGTVHIRSDKGDATTALEGVDGAMRHEPLVGDAWDVFYRYATFDEILGSVDPDGGDSVLDKMQKFYSSVEGVERTKLALQIIRDSPKILMGEEFAVELIETLEKARWGVNKAGSEQALNLLKDHLMPMRPGGKIPLPSNIHAVRAVLEELAKHLSDKCKAAINDGLRTCIDRGEGLDEDLYNELTVWARNNSEFRINRLPRTELNALIFRPKTYASDLLEARFRSSLKTMSRNKA